MEIKARYGWETSFLENVSPAEAWESFAGFASRGYNVIFGHGFEFGDIALKVAPLFPDTKFIITSSDIALSPNVGSITNNIWEAGYLAGITAAYLSEKRHVGAVGGMNIPSISGSLDAFEAGVASVDAGIKVSIVYSGSFEDVAKAKEAALAIIENGADILFHNADQSAAGVFGACREKGARAIGMIADQAGFASDTIVTSAICAVSASMAAVALYIIDGTWQPRSYSLGVKEGVVSMAPFKSFDAAVPPSLTTALASALDAMKNGTLDARAETEKYIKRK
jgi:basic membrane protein A